MHEALTLTLALTRYLDYVPFEASWRQREGSEVVATPVVGCRQQGSSVGFAYARLRCVTLTQTPTQTLTPTLAPTPTLTLTLTPTLTLTLTLTT